VRNKEEKKTKHRKFAAAVGVFVLISSRNWAKEVGPWRGKQSEQKKDRDQVIGKKESSLKKKVGCVSVSIMC